MEAVMNDRVRSYFDGAADSFDSIYRTEKSFTQKLVDGLFHGVIHRRYELTFELCGEGLTGKRALDIGCGSGRYSIELARRGAEVKGLDFAPAMVELAAKMADEAGVDECCHFEQCDFLSWNQPHDFDICLGIGFFDYIEKPEIVLEKTLNDSSKNILASFPKKGGLLYIQRKIRYWLRNCPLYFYSEKRLHAILKTLGKEYSIIDNDREFFVIINS